MLQDTIVALATAQIEGAIAIIRLSGDDAIAIAAKMYKGKSRLQDVASHTIHYGKIIDDKSNEMIDEVLISLFRAPRTYTREDVVEINCHGGVAATRAILLLAVRLGARLATPGEFTKRAFLNGRIDLTQAEAVQDIIEAENDKNLALALQNLSGKLSDQIQSFRQQTVQILANIEVNIDYPEYDDVTFLTSELLIPQIEALKAEMLSLLRTAHTGQLIKNGVKTAIIGKPNVGKSSLLNALLQEQKAIVTDVAGTTRDIVEGQIKLGSLVLHLVDTAGIRQTEDVIEQMGIQKAHELVEAAELILLVIDGSAAMSEQDQALLELTTNKKRGVVINKADLPAVPLEQLRETDCIARLSARTTSGIDGLQELIVDVLEMKLTDNNMVYLTNIRHISLLERAVSSLDQALMSAEMGLPIDIITIDLQDCYAALGEVLGLEMRDDLLDTLFSAFCLGK